jgi:non-heme chloroperoxidase
MRFLAVLFGGVLSFASVFASGLAHAEYVQIASGVKIHYEQAGSGAQTVLFVPGWLMTTDVFQKQLEHFKGSKSVRFITYDPRGQGLSTKTAGGMNYEQRGRDLDAFIKALGLHDIVLAGWSYGGLEALSYVHQFGDAKIRGFIDIDAPPRTTGPDNVKEWVWYRYDDSDSSFKFYTLTPQLDRNKFDEEFAKWMLEDSSKASLEWVKKMSDHTSGSDAARLNAASWFCDYTSDVKQIDAHKPVLFFVQEALGPVARDWIKTNAPNAAVEAYGKHMMFHDHAEQFNARIDQYLSALH